MTIPWQTSRWIYAACGIAIGFGIGAVLMYYAKKSKRAKKKKSPSLIQTFWNSVDYHKYFIILGVFVIGLSIALSSTIALDDAQERYKVLANGGYMLMAVSMAMYIFLIQRKHSQIMMSKK